MPQAWGGWQLDAGRGGAGAALLQVRVRRTAAALALRAAGSRLKLCHRAMITRDLFYLYVRCTHTFRIRVTPKQFIIFIHTLRKFTHNVSVTSHNSNALSTRFLEIQEMCCNLVHP